MSIFNALLTVNMVFASFVPFTNGWGSAEDDTNNSAVSSIRSSSSSTRAIHEKEVPAFEYNEYLIKGEPESDDLEEKLLDPKVGETVMSVIQKLYKETKSLKSLLDNPTLDKNGDIKNQRREQIRSTLNFLSHMGVKLHEGPTEREFIACHNIASSVHGNTPISTADRSIAGRYYARNQDFDSAASDTGVKESEDRLNLQHWTEEAEQKFKSDRSERRETEHRRK